MRGNRALLGAVPFLAMAGCLTPDLEEGSHAAQQEPPPPLEVVSLDRVVSCVGEVDPGADPFYAVDHLRCHFELPALPGLRWGRLYAAVSRQGAPPVHVSILEGPAIAQEVSFAFRADEYPVELSVTLSAQFQGSGSLEQPATSNGTSMHWAARRAVANRPALGQLTAEGPLAVAAPFELWPVALWPSSELQSAWREGGARMVHTRLAYTFPIQSAALNVAGPTAATEVTVRRERWASPSTVSDLAAMAADLAYLPVPRGGFSGQAPGLWAQVRGQDQDVEATSLVSSPGYYVMDASGQAVLTARDALPPLAGAAAEPEPEPEPVAPGGGGPLPPVDPCAGACTDAQACVAGACVTRAQQTQSAYCNAPTRACDADEDQDCADDHACANGLCVRLTCQTQSAYCNAATSACDPGDDGDCAADHACVGGLCRRLACQTQSAYCNAPTAPCDGDDDGDCAADHACAGGLCRRLSCQTQSLYCSAPTNVCDPGDDADCAEAHHCVDELCHRDSCH